MLITLTTDFGLRDSFVGTLKGVLLSIAPHATLVDLSHEIPAQDVLAGALALEEACPYFPPKTIHLAVVDPGVGGARAAVAIETARAFFVGPDNGIFDLVLNQQPARRVVRLTVPLAPERGEGLGVRGGVCPTFHGRDLFAPAAAQLARGVPLEKLGEPFTLRAHLQIPAPAAKGAALQLHVLHIDRFGNLMTDLTREQFARWNPAGRSVNLRVGRKTIRGLAQTFSDVPPGKPLAYFGSGGRLEIAVNRGRADKFFNASAIVLSLNTKTPRHQDTKKKL